jgi:hypothetical protein
VLRALPVQQQGIFAELLESENLLPRLSVRSLPHEIGVSFFKEILEIRAMTPDWLVFQTLCSTVLSHALRLLDPNSVGLAIRVIQCMPPSHDGKIRSLRASEGQGIPSGNATEKSNLECQPFFLGGESLAGYVVKTCHPKSEQNLASNASLFSTFQRRPFVSTLAAPILSTQRIAGCLLVSSTQAEYFLSSTRLSLVKDYTHLIALAFATEQFYPVECIELQTMPPFELQQTHTAAFRQRVVALMKTRHTTARPLTWAQAEELICQQLEEEMIQLVASQRELL